MAGQLGQAIAVEFPEYFIINNLLQLAAQTWPRFGLSAADLGQMDLWTLELLRVALGGG